MKDSQFNLGMLYARGLGVPQSLETSYKWFALAAIERRHGCRQGARQHRPLARRGDGAKLTAEVKAWKPAPVDLAANFAPIGTWKRLQPGPDDHPQGYRAKVQAALARLGYDVGTPDGLAGTKTADAIKAFERGTGMSEIGAINPRLLAVLGSQPV